MICSKCGKEIKPIDAKYCRDCGACYCKSCRESHDSLCQTCFGNLEYYS